MRKELQKIAGVRKRFVATFERFGKKSGYQGRQITTLLFSDIKDKSGQVYTDHIWFTTNKGFEKCNLIPGDRISFDARVKKYKKGYQGNRNIEDVSPVTIDYKLSHPNNIEKHIMSGTQKSLF